MDLILVQGTLWVYLLGLVLFLVFVNDLPLALQSTVADIYADDLMMRYSTDYKLAPQAIGDGLQSGLDRLHKGQITTK